MSIPNTLTIFINTRIRNYPKIRYEPNMTVPKIKSTNVFFDPLIKLSNSVARSLPNGAPASERFTQFFNKNEFSGLIARTISSAYIGQKKLTLIEATRDGYIDNNIRTTLDQLFEPNNIFYIKDKPYTIYSYNWTKGDWKVDTKSFEKEFAYIPYGMNYSYYREGTGRVNNSQANRELKKLMEQGEELVNGPVVDAGYSKFKQDEKGKIVPDKPSPEILTPKEKKEFEKEKEEVFIKKIESLPVGQQSLFRDLIKIDLVESPDKPNFATSPLTQLVLFQDKDSLKREVESNLQLLGPSYNQMNDANTKYLKKMSEFDLLLGNILLDVPEESETQQNGGNIMIDKGNYDKLANDLKDRITAYTSKKSINKKTIDDILLDTKLKNSLITIIQKLVDLKKKILDSFIKLIEIYNESMKLLNKYYISIINFYSELKKIKYAEYEGSEDKKSIFILFLLLIDFDIETFTYLSQIIVTNNEFLQSMKSRIELSNRNTDKTTFVEKLKRYYEYKYLLSIEKNELDICIQKIIQFKEANIMRLLSVSYNKTDIFLNEKLKKFSLNRINSTRDLIKVYGSAEEAKSYVKETRENKLDSILNETSDEFKIAQKKLDVANRNLELLRVNDDNTARSRSDIDNAIELQNQAISEFQKLKSKNNLAKSTALDSKKSDKLSMSQTELKELVKKNPFIKKDIIESLDVITLYSKVSLIAMAKETVLITSQLNLINIFYRFLIETKNYYVNIFSQITGTRNYSIVYLETDKYIDLLKYIPTPIFFENKENFDLLVIQIKNTEKSIIDILNVNRPSLQMQLDLLSNEYKNRLDDFIPSFVDSSVLLNCKLIVNPNNYDFVLDRELNTPLTNFEKKQDWFTSQIKYNNDDDTQYDLREFFYFIEEIIDSATQEEKNQNKKRMKTNKYFLENFSVCGNSESPGDSIFSSVANAFNGQLFFNKKQSTNKYSIRDGPMKGYFSAESLRNAVSEEFNEEDMEIFGIKFIENYKDEPETSPNRKDFNFLFEGNVFIGNDIQLIKEKMKIPVINGGVFYNPKIIIQKLMKIFEINILVIDENVCINEDYSIKFDKGVPVKFGDRKGFIDQVNPDGTVKILQTNMQYVDNINKSTIDIVSPLYYSFNCSFNEDSVRETGNESGNPVIFLIGKNYSLIPDYELLYIDKMKNGINTESDEESEEENGRVVLINNEINTIIHQVINELNSRLNNRETIQTCPDRDVQRDQPMVLQGEAFIHSYLPPQLKNFKVVKTVGDGTCALHSMLLIISPNYRRLNFEQAPDDICYDASRIRSRVGILYRDYLKKHMDDLINQYVIEGFLTEEGDVDPVTILQDFNNDEYLSVNIFQYFANYFDVNILIYDSVQRRFIPFYFHNTKNNKKWCIIYQTQNHFSAVCEKGPKNKFLFDRNVLSPILDTIEYNPDGIEENKLMKEPPIDSFVEENEVNKDDEDDEENNDLVKYVFVSPPIVLGVLNSLNCQPERLINAIARSNSDSDPGSKNSSNTFGGGSSVPKSSYSNVNASNRISVENDSKLSYYVIIDLELYPGKEGIPLSQKAVLSCQTRYEKIRQAYANLFGLQYRPNEFNSSIYTPPKKSKEESEKKYEGKERDTDDEEDRYMRSRSRNRSRRRMPYYPRDYTRRLDRYPPRDYDRSIEE
uniref:OTU domain-containing protein n=1 Tax=viral metagenome TaxID=1070528 RepID=A0A6C0KXD7_9ZZZZ